MTVNINVKKEKCPFFDQQYHLLMQILSPIFFHKLERTNITHCPCISCPLSTGCRLLFSLVTRLFSVLCGYTVIQASLSCPDWFLISPLGLADRDPRRLLMGA